VRRLIVNADDFGLTAGVNRGILEAHARGIVTSATLMACGAEFEQAAALATQSPKLSVGCHVVLVDGSPVLERTNVSNLMENSGGRFRESLSSFAWLAVLGRLDQQQIEAEITAQIRKLQAAGIQVSHLDTHKHTHMFPVVLRALLRAATSCGVRAVRNPFEPLVFASTGQWKRQFQLRILRRYQRSFREALAASGLVTPDGCIGVLATGGLNLTTFTQLTENLSDGTWEFVSHPGYNDADLGNVTTRLRESREKELEILTAAGIKKMLQRENIELISYRDFASLSPEPEVPSPLTVKQ